MMTRYSRAVDGDSMAIQLYWWDGQGCDALAHWHLKGAALQPLLSTGHEGFNLGIGTRRYRRMSAHGPWIIYTKTWVQC